MGKKTARVFRGGPVLFLSVLGMLQASVIWARPAVVLIPGAGSSGDSIYVANFNWSIELAGGTRYFARFPTAFAQAGMDSFVCPREEDQDRRTLQQRAADCAETILARRPSCAKGKARDLILLGHSMGGLIARLLAQDSRVRDCVDTVLTVSTPHRGTPLADYAIRRSKEDDEWFDFFGKIAKLIHFTPKYLRYLPQLKLDRNGEDPRVFLPQDTPDNPEVEYLSVTNSVSGIALPPLELGRLIIRDELEDRGITSRPYGTRNDGIVPEFSMPYGKVLGHLEVNHWASACMDPLRYTDECEQTVRFLIKALKPAYTRLVQSGL